MGTGADEGADEMTAEATTEAPLVLVVDDEPMLRRLVREVLTRSGNEVVDVESPDAALEVLRDTPVDLVLTDIHMPGFRSGLELVKDVRDEHPGVPVIVITGQGTSDDLVDALDNGAAGFLMKPFHLAALQSKVAEALKRRVQPEGPLSARRF
jgi:DNA-binding NtrC family response regulator